VAGGAEIIVSFVADLTKLAAGAKDVEKTGKAASKGLDWKGIAKWTAAAGGIAAAGGFIATAAKSTATLAKQTMALQRATGLDTKTASEWVLLLGQRGVSTDAFTRSMLSLSKAMEAWRTAGAAAPSVLKDLGVSFADVQKGDIGAVLKQVSDGLARIDNPAQKAATAAKLFGKAGAQLVPIVGKGSAEMQKSLDATNKYGAALSGSTLKAVQDQTKAQRELAAMHAGVANTIGGAVLPVQAQLFGILVDVLSVATPLLQNQKLMTVAVTAGAAVWVAYKAALIASSLAGSKDVIVTVAQTAAKWAQTAATAALAAAQWVLNAAMAAGLLPMLAVVAAIVVVIAVAVLLWKNWDRVSAGLAVAFAKIKAAALAVWNWIRSNWPLLLAILTGPMGLAVLAISRNWSTITGAFQKGVSAAKGALADLRDFLNSVKAKVASYLDTIATAMGKPGSAAHAAVAAVKSAFNDLVKWLDGKVGAISSAAGRIASAIKSPINAVLSAWGSTSISLPRITIPNIPGTKVGGGTYGGQTYHFPRPPLLAQGGVLERPTLFVGGEAGREIVTPERLLREIVGEHRGGDTFQLVMQPRTADAADVAYAFRRLELLRTGR
jgi:ABC-type multidrug transport system fused ATPase/permease subunit